MAKKYPVVLNPADEAHLQSLRGHCKKIEQTAPLLGAVLRWSVSSVPRNYSPVFFSQWLGGMDESATQAFLSDAEDAVVIAITAAEPPGRSVMLTNPATAQDATPVRLEFDIVRLRKYWRASSAAG